MKNELSKKAKQVQEFIMEKGFEFRVVELPDSTRTAQQAAKAVGCDVAQIAKSLVFKDEETHELVLIIASGQNRVSLEKIKSATGKSLVQADGKFVKQKTGFAIGGIPPVGHDEKLTTILDPHLQSFDRIWAAAGTPFAVFELQSSDIEPLTGGAWVELAE
ncbi:MAG: YbaK/EbsC family protein [Desulfobacteraceae bacterium]|nr:YbaK/EbsC family protein [Desulfobacteraceae bacterium]